MERLFMLLASLSGFIAVAAGAFGAHALKKRLSEDMFAVFEVGVRYQMYHVFALIAVAWMISKSASPVLTTAGVCFVIGSLVFSGSLYLLALTGTRWLGAITPIGGLAFLLGWLCLAWAVWKT